MRNVVVLDLETMRSAQDCRLCYEAKDDHMGNPCGAHYTPIGWDDHALLGLSIGCVWSFKRGAPGWFDVYTLEATVRDFVESQPLLVSFNGIGFDFPLMRALLAHDAVLCERFAALAMANGLPRKSMDGATAPHLWAQGHYAEVIAYNVADVMKTKHLFEMACRGEPILRGNGQGIMLPRPPVSVSVSVPA
jgi:hypothetical protein